MKEKKPIIGITADYCSEKAGYVLAKEYVQAVAAGGGIPLILPPVNDYAVSAVIERLDGVLISGGDFDLNPELYGESRHVQLGKLKPYRTDYEMRLLHEALARDIPLLGICGGLQLMNVALGGSLYQHLPAQTNSHIKHEQKGKSTASAHSISLAPKSILYNIINASEVMVNSTHHQAVKQAGQGLKAVAWAPDGIIEAVEAPDYRFVLGVQWHPEALINQQDIWKKLFEVFIRQGKKK
jgi:putative glutamine amidotransferase